MVLGNATSSVVAVTRRSFSRPHLPLPARLPRLLPELVLLVTANAIYKYGRKVANGQEDAALHHADRVWSLERAVHLPSEQSFQQLLLHSHAVVHLANYLYATVHFPAMVIFLGYMFLRHRAHYLWIRRAVVIQTMLALLGHLFFPLAPPRMLPGAGMVDTAQVYGPSVYGATPDGDSMANQFAAMPSLHVGWALAIAVGLITAAPARRRSRARWLWLLHPAVTMLVVVGTANHYWLDGIVGSALLGVALLVIPGPDPVGAARSAGRRTAARRAWPLKGRRRPPDLGAALALSARESEGAGAGAEAGGGPAGGTAQGSAGGRGGTGGTGGVRGG
jgi:PAP2 superfamily